MSDISTWSSSAGSNNSSSPNGFPEGMAPSGLNDSSREVMAAIRRQWEDAEWFNWGDAVTYGSATSFTVPGDLTSRYAVGKRVRVQGTITGTVYGTIATSVYVSSTTVTLTLDSGSLSNESLTVSLGIISSDTISKGTLSLENVDNTSDADKPVSDATQTALDLKAPLSSPAFTDAPTAPTPATDDNSTEIANTEFVNNFVGALSAQSSAYSIVSGGQAVWSHGLGAEPFTVIAVLVCLTAEKGYSIGDKIIIGTSNMTTTSSSQSSGVAINFDSTQVVARMGDDNTAFWALRKDTGARAELTNSRWELYLRASLT